MTSEPKQLRGAEGMPQPAWAALLARLRALAARPAIERGAWRLLLGIAGIQVILSLPRLVWGSIWYDEFLSISTIRLGWGQIARGAYPLELHPPLYFLLLKAWVAVFGPAELAMRLLSLGLACASLVVLFLLARQLVDTRAALATALLFAIHPMYIYYATEIRMYALLILCSLAAVFAAWRYCEAPRASALRLCGVGAAVLAAMYTHYFGGLIALAIGVLCLVRLALIRNRRPIAVLAVLLACALIHLPSVYPMIQRQIQAYRVLYATPSGQPLTWQVFPAMLSGSASLVFSRAAALNSVSLLAAAAGCLGLWRSGRKIVVLTSLWCIGLAASLAFVVSANGFDVASRYMLHISLLALILLGSTWMWQAPARSWLSPAWLGAAVLGMYLYAGTAFALESAQLHPNWRAVAATIGKLAHPGEPIVLSWDATPIQFYLGDHPSLTRQKFEAELRGRPGHPSYLLVQSEPVPALPLARPPTELWRNAAEHVSVSRYVP